MDFEEYLAQLADKSARIGVSSLRRLSSLDRARTARLGQVWPAIDVRRRRRIVNQMLDLVEDNFDLNFDAVFLRGLEDDDAEVRYISIQGLWEYEGNDLVPVLLRLLANDPSPAVRAQAALALGRFVTLWQLGNLRDRYFAQIEAGLRRVLEDPDEPEEVRARALEAMGPCDAPWVRQKIREAYESGVRRMKVGALFAMGRSCQPRWLPLLLRELGSDDPELRYEAATACGSIGEQSPVPQLLPLLHDADAEVRAATIGALGEIGGDQARDALLEIVAGPPGPERAAALSSLAMIEFMNNPLGFNLR